MTAWRSLRVALAVVLVFAVPGPALAERSRTRAATVDLLLDLQVRPFAIAHRGFGETLPGHRRPIENTVAAVRKGFKAGASVVEVDVQLTRDGRAAAFHHDVLPDATCLNALTLAELQARLPHVPTLEAVLEEAARFNQASGPLRGIVIVELKAAAPLCDPDDTQERAIVAAATRAIRETRMVGQVMLTSFSPALLYLAWRHAPEITRILAVSGLQFLDERAIEERLQTEVTLIDKRLDLGLQWAELGSGFRLPGYESVEQLVETARRTGVRVIEADRLLLDPAGRTLVPTLQALGLKVFGFTANSREDWRVLESLGVDGIYTNDVRQGVKMQAPIP